MYLLNPSRAKYGNRKVVDLHSTMSVSYTHLDGYKRQGYEQEHQNHRQDQNQYAQDHAGVINRQHKIIQSVPNSDLSFIAPKPSILQSML